ncbi:MAG: protein kinase [Gemmataceae bacterium]|nr:protein kinase [Gemmataceae bacterium]
MSRTPKREDFPTVNLKGAVVGMSLTDTPVPPARERAVQFGSSVVSVVLTREGVPERIGEHDILAEIGRGGMSVVYKAYHRSLRRLVALKTLQADGYSDLELQERIRAEAEAVARIQHPGVIQVFETGTVQLDRNRTLPTPYIALEFVDGGDLAKLCAKPQPARVAARIVAKLARAVAIAHDRGVIHRDLKPANVLLTRDGEPKIADFGVAKQLRAERDSAGRFLTQTGMVVGTPEYMAPEQARGADATASADIYALGVILYELLVARVPLQAPTAAETMQLIQRLDPLAPRQLQPDLPRDIETICLKCLEKDPAKRYATARELAEDLERFLEHRPIVARRVSEWERFGRWCRRNPHFAATLGGIAGIFLTAFLLVSWSYRQAETARAGAEAARADESRQRKIAQSRGEQERWERYRANIVAAAGSLQAKNAGNAGRMLEAAPVEHRNWEWRHYLGQLDRSQHVERFETVPHAGTLLALDGDRISFVSGPRALHVWDLNGRRDVVVHAAESDTSYYQVAPDGGVFGQLRGDVLEIADLATGKIRMRVPGLKAHYMSYHFSSDSRRLATGQFDGRSQLWDIATGRELASLTPRECLPMPIAIDRSGRWAVFVKEGLGVVEIGDFERGTIAHRLQVHEHGIFGAFFNPAGTHVVVTERFPSNTLKLFRLSDGALEREFAGHSNCIACCAFSTDGRRIASGSDDQTVCVWDVETGRRLFEGVGHLGRVNTLAFSPDGRTLASGSHDQTIHLRDAETGVTREVLFGHSSGVFDLVFAKDGHRLLTISLDRSLRVWDTRAIGAETLRGHGSFVYGTAFHPDGERVASAAWDGTARLWNATTGQELASFDHGPGAVVTAVAFDPAGARLATRSRAAVQLIDLATGRTLKRWDVPVNSWHDTRLAFDPTGRWIATGGDGCVLRVFDSRGTDDFALAGHANEVRDVAFSPDGRWLVSGGDDGDCEVLVWDFAARRVVHRLHGHTQGIFGLAFSAAGDKLATASVDNTVKIWNTADWSELGTLGHPSRVYGVAFSPDGSRLACACADNSIRLWDPKTLQEATELRGHGQYVHHVAFSPDGTRLVSGSGDKTLRIWDTRSLKDRARHFAIR